MNIKLLWIFFARSYGFRTGSILVWFSGWFFLVASVRLSLVFEHWFLLLMGDCMMVVAVVWIVKLNIYFFDLVIVCMSLIFRLFDVCGWNCRYMLGLSFFVVFAGLWVVGCWAVFINDVYSWSSPAISRISKIKFWIANRFRVDKILT